VSTGIAVGAVIGASVCYYVAVGFVPCDRFQKTLYIDKLAFLIVYLYPIAHGAFPFEYTANCKYFSECPWIHKLFPSFLYVFSMGS